MTAPAPLASEPTSRISVIMHYFAWVRENMGTDTEVVELEDGIETVGELINWLAARDARGKAAFCDPSQIRAAVDGEMKTLGASIRDALQVALFPPVTGG